MASEITGAPKTEIIDVLRSIPGRWLEPRSKDRDEAFRERSIRVAIALVILVGLVSFALTIFVFTHEWKFFSYPTLHVLVLFGFFTAAYTITRRKVDVSAILVVGTSLLAAFGFVIVIGKESPYVGVFSGIPIFMSVILISALVMPRKTILPTSIVGLLLYTLAALSVNSALLNSPAVELSQAIISSFVLLPAEGVILYRLRVEFDARLDAMRVSIREAEVSRQEAEEARREAEIDRKRAEESDKAKSQFLANMSHELRTPLNAIIGYDEAMIGGLAGEFTAQQTKLLGHIQYNSRRLLGLINDILDLSKIESGALQVFLAPMSPRKVIQETAESLRSLTDEKKIYLNVGFSEEVPEVVLGDSNKLQQIIANLLSNAIKFTEQGGVSVDVDVFDSNLWQIKVRDTGIGMPADAINYIFEPFQQVDTTERRQYKGTGLGLAITKRLVERLGGMIEVDSKLGEGSVFTVKLPRAHVPAESAAITQPETVELKI